jgi:hypothetical protein
MGCEDDITRTTIYMPKYLYEEKKRREQSEEKFNLSQTVTTILETQFFGDGSTNLQFELDRTQKQIEKLDMQKSILKTRCNELEKLIDTQQERYDKEIKIYNKLKRFINNRIENARLSPEAGIDYRKLESHIKSSFFPNNNFNSGVLKDIMHRCETDCFDFEFFKNLRKGNKDEE